MNLRAKLDDISNYKVGFYCDLIFFFCKSDVLNILILMHFMLFENGSWEEENLNSMSGGRKRRKGECCRKFQ